MPQNPPPKIFISYAWENQPLARQLQRDLQNDGVEVFVVARGLVRLFISVVITAIGSVS
jgi:hypothetical protein